MKLNTIIVDDEFYARQSLKVLLEQDADVRLVAECRNGAEAVQAVRHYQPDLLILDIQMPEINGFEVLRQLSDLVLPIVIFSTAYDQYALQAFEVHALDYLLKPYSDQRFFEALNRAKQQLGQAQPTTDPRLAALLQQWQPESPTRIAIRSAGKTKLVHVETIIWVEAADQYVRLHTTEGTFLHRESMSRIEQQLTGPSFFRTHRSAIVALNRITELETYAQGDYYVHLNTGDRIRLARNRKEALEQQLGL
ncbi:MAG: LytR/AlgR family response regulator transcription factor [Salibacteraceae bacterium]